ncbi:MAG: hypothetical protein M3O15_01720, partial [Acidobacteriota bacterium]|nr:hypothetical protein [Acidobacteriota bacterium]
NIIYPKGKQHSTAHYYALARNAATLQRDLYLRLDGPVEVLRRLGSVTVDTCGVKTLSYVPGAVLTLPAMAPGEVRPVRVSIPLLDPAPGMDLPLSFTEVTDPGPAGSPRDGFAISPLPSSVEDAARYNLVFARAVFARAAILANSPTAAALASKTGDFLLGNPAISSSQYVAFLRQQAASIRQVVSSLPRPPSTCGLSTSLDLEHFLSALGAGDPNGVAPVHSDLLQSVDTWLTLVQLAANPGP